MQIREADIELDRQSLIEFLKDNLEGHGGEAHFDWLYRDNPDGRARAWVAMDSDDSLLGAAAAFPRRVRVNGEPLVCWNLGDFAIKKEYRSLGPAIALQKACIAEVVDGDIPFSYDHPSRGMMAIYERIGFKPTGQVTRFVRLLRLDNKVQGFWKERFIGKGVIALGNLVLSLGSRGSLESGGYRAVVHEGRFDQRFSDLEERVAPRLQVVGCRSAEYLNWRYRDNPLAQYDVVTVQDHSRLCGYAVLHKQGSSAWLMDLFGEQDAEITQAILAGVIYTLKREQIETLNAPVLPSSPLVPILKRWGFRGRESAPFVIATTEGGKWDGLVNNETGWFLTHGDRDA